MLRFDQDRRGDPHEGVDLVTPDFIGLAGVLRGARGGRGRARCRLRAGARAPSRAGRALAARGERRARPAAEYIAALVQGCRQKPITTQMGTVFPNRGATAAAASDIPWSEVGLRIEWLGEPERFARLAADWDRMLPGDARPFDLHAWYSAWFLAFGERGLHARLPGLEGRQPRGRLPARAPPAALARRHGQRAHPGVPAGRPEPRGGARGGGRRARARQQQRLPAGHPVRRHVAHRAARGHRRGRTAPHDRRASTCRPSSTTTGTYEDWRAGRGRAGARRSSASAARCCATTRRSSRWSAAPDDLDAELARGFAVEASGWKGESGTAILSDERTMTFYRRVADVVRRARASCACRAS